MTRDDDLRRRVVAVAADLFAEHGYTGTKITMVAIKAGVTAHTVRRLTGGKAELFKLVMQTTVTSAAAREVAEAVRSSTPPPPLAAMLMAAREVFTDPGGSWQFLELEAMAHAHRNEALQAIESERIQQRRDNIEALFNRVRRAGGIDDDVSDRMLAHFAMALSAGLGLIDPLQQAKPTQAEWTALMARIGAALAPPDLLLTPEHEARTPWRVRVEVPDQPGGTARLTRALGALHMYTAASQVIDTVDGYRTIDLAVTAPESVAEETILAAARSAGRNAYVTGGSPLDATDLPTRVLDGATELVTRPGWAPIAAAQLVEADRVEVTSAIEGEDDRADILRLQWTADRHVVLHRDWAPFARAEKSRVSALLRLSAAISELAGEGDRLGWVEPVKGGTVWIRLGYPEDADAVADMHHRCSERSRYLRYVSSGEWRDVQLRRLAGGHRGATLVVMSAEGTIVGLGNVFPLSAHDTDTAEIALIVEDAYQGRGVGTVLMRHQIEMAQRLGFREVYASVLTENTGVMRLLQATGLPWVSTIDSGETTMRAALPPAAVMPPESS